MKRKFRDLPELAAREIYIHGAVARGLPRVFFQEYEPKRREHVGRRVAFRLADVVYFFAVAAAQGVVGNLAFHALCRAVRAIRKPKQEIGSAELSLETVVSRKTYSRLRREKHPLARPSRASAGVKSKLETKYKLMVTLERTRSS